MSDFAFSFFSALIKSVGLRTDARVDDRSFWINYVAPLSVLLAIPLVYPRMIAIHDLGSKVWIRISLRVLIIPILMLILLLGSQTDRIRERI